MNNFLNFLLHPIFQRLFEPSRKKELLIIVGDAQSLNSLAFFNGLKLLLKPGIPVWIPEFVRADVMRDPGQPGTQSVADWIRAHEGDGVLIKNSETCEEHSEVRSSSRPDEVAAVVLSLLLQSRATETVLLLEDIEALRSTGLVPLPDNVHVMSGQTYLEGAANADRTELIMEALKSQIQHST